jgi:hypothetical protein
MLRKARLNLAVKVHCT